MFKVEEFRENIAKLPREELLEILEKQNPEIHKQVNRIEWVFKNKLSHLAWNDGSPITERNMTNQELALLIDPPFTPDKLLTKAGITTDQQREIFIAMDPVMWGKYVLGVEMRAYQILILRDPSNRKIVRAGRRLGKTVALALKILHYISTHKNGKVLIMAPMKAHVDLIYKEVMRQANLSPMVLASIKRNVTSPQFFIELTNGSTAAFFTTGMSSGGKCLTPDHDVLTENGWKGIAEVDEGEMVCSWDDGQQVWVPVEQTWEYDYEGDLVRHSGRQLSFLCTPNHKFLAKTKAPNSPLRYVRADELKNYIIPVNGVPATANSKEFSGDELELWGWWISEGGGFDGNMAKICQTKPEGRKRIVELAENLNLHHKIYQYEIRIKWKPPIFSGTNAYNKFIPRELMQEQERQRLLDGLLRGDGWYRRSGWEYSSSSYQLIQDVQELAVRLGLRAQLREKKIIYKPVAGGLPNRHWIVAGYPITESYVSTHALSNEYYQGKVHCLTVSTGVFLTRHKGLIHITGNSNVARGQEASLIVLDEFDYMAPDDLDAIYAMLQQTSENQDEKELIGASTPTGRKEKFWEWAHSTRFKEFYFPSYVNPFFSKEIEEEMHEQYLPMAYRHEIEADWGEDVEGVYPRRSVDRAFVSPDWEYNPFRETWNSVYIIGVDWDKYGAGTNIVALEMCHDNYDGDPRFAGKIRLAFREETPKEEFTLLNATNRILQLNEWMRPAYIYVDRGYGEMQCELLIKHGLENPSSGLKDKVVGVSFSEMVEIRDPLTRQLVKKEIKPYMVDNLYRFLENNQLIIPASDDELYMQLISYVVKRFTDAGRPVFEASGSQVDHAHDALILGCLAIAQNYGDFSTRFNLARAGKAVSNEAFLPMFSLSDNPDIREWEEDKIEEMYGSQTSAPVVQKRSFTGHAKRATIQRTIRRKGF